MSTGRQAILEAFDQLFDTAVGRLSATCTPEERAQARAEFAERMTPALEAVESAQKIELPATVVDDMRHAIERLTPADIAGLVASIPLAQRPQELLKAVAFDHARQAAAAPPLEIWRQHQDEIALLLTDMMMPEGLSGRQLAERILAEKPDLPVLFTSGYSLDVVDPGFAAQNGQAFLQKPFMPDELISVLKVS